MEGETVGGMKEGMKECMKEGIHIHEPECTEARVDINADISKQSATSGQSVGIVR
ncbi:hypothetical protein J6590_058770 [Homalodisca vitripennis]|nr:hypothetical protein J6590_058770 [Homalodisca vitripennis]